MRIAYFTRDQVVEEVCAESEINVENEDLQLSLEEVLKLSLDKFRHLSSTANFSDFREEARGQLLSVYPCHEEGIHGMDKALLSSLPVWPMISSEIILWLNGLNRRMSANPKARNPWTIELSRDLPEELFSSLRKAI